MLIHIHTQTHNLLSILIYFQMYFLTVTWCFKNIFVEVVMHLFQDWLINISIYFLNVISSMSVSVCVLWVCWWLALMCSEEVWAFFAGSDFFRGTRVLSKLWHTHTLTALTKLCISLSVCHTLLLCGDCPLAQLLTHFPPSPSSTCSEYHHTHTHTHNPNTTSNRTPHSRGFSH